MNVTTIVTGEKGEHEFTRHGLEEYVSDYVLLLDNRVEGQISKRRLRVIKYRGSGHISDECPFIISDDGVRVLPITSLKLQHSALYEYMSTGIEDLDKMLDNKGFMKATSILVTGTSGTGKSSLSASFAHSTCSLGKTCLYFSFEESKNQIIRNMQSIGLNLTPFIEKKTANSIRTQFNSGT